MKKNKENEKKVCIALGTRPEIIKFTSVLRELHRLSANFFVIHTGQHYSHEMDGLIFEDLKLSKPKYNLNVGSGTQSDQTAEILRKSGEILHSESPDIVIVQGDTNSSMAVALAAVKLHIKVAHIEAGLRSFDRRMPEEINRVIIDHISTILYTPTSEASQNLIKEGVSKNKLLRVGNTVVDAVIQNVKLAQKSKILSEFKLVKDKYALITLHRPENVDEKTRFEQLLTGICALALKSDLKFIWPIHPRTLATLHKFKLTKTITANPNIMLTSPVGFLDFLHLQSSARIILTDSGGIQEEACILKVPCLTLRDNTERAESIAVGSNMLSKPDAASLTQNFTKMLKKPRKWRNPFGDGKSAQKIVSHLLNYLALL